MHRDGNIKCRQIYDIDLNDSIKMLFMPCLDSEKNLCRSCFPEFRVGVFVRVRTDGRTLRLLHRLTRAWHQAHMNKQSLTACFFSICPFHCWYLDRWHDVTDTQVFPQWKERSKEGIKGFKDVPTSQSLLELHFR